ncbi:type II secretion system protein [Opitutus sp. ER46]|uniref:type II secretion system protein n=1 Tax=Opitutus sp. ER46 TaxID=2161864 RepID=UPI000D326E03|nr:type II secretion system protein [Opitutus sp. ER46]PTX98477.1 hypothetical protein DB354_04200 [Opitutus sp. ER46]
MNTRGPGAAFTLLEILIVVTMLGLLGTMVVGGFRNVVPAARETAAVNKARVVNAARITYALTVPAAATEWDAALSDAQRCTLLIEAGALTGAPADWLAATGGYSLALTGGLRARTVLRNKAGATLAYTD